MTTGRFKVKCCYCGVDCICLHVPGLFKCHACKTEFRVIFDERDKAVDIGPAVRQPRGGGEVA